MHERVLCTVCSLLQLCKVYAVANVTIISDLIKPLHVPYIKGCTLAIRPCIPITDCMLAFTTIYTIMQAWVVHTFATREVLFEVLSPLIQLGTSRKENIFHFVFTVNIMVPWWMKNQWLV